MLPTDVPPPGVAKPSPGAATNPTCNPSSNETVIAELLTTGWKLCRWMEESKSQAVASNPNRFFRYFGEWASVICEMLEQRSVGGAKLFVLAIMKAGLAVVSGIK